MKKTSQLLFLLISINTSAQLNITEDGFTLNYLDPSSNCLANNVPNNGMIMSHGATFEQGLNYLTPSGLELQSVVSFQSLPSDQPVFFALPFVTGVGPTMVCSNVNQANKGVDLSHESSGLFEIDLIANVDNAMLEVYVGGQGEWLPATSTWNTGSGDKIDAILTTGSANQLRTYYFNFQALNPTAWNTWAGKNKIQSIGFISGTPGAKFTIKEIRIGTEANLTPDSCNYLRADYDIIQPLNCQNNLATIEAKGYQGTGDYDFTWSGVSNILNDSIAKVDAGGFYSLIVNDEKCSDTVAVYVAPGPDVHPNIIETFFLNGEFRTGFTRLNSFLLKNRGCISTDGELYLVLDPLVEFDAGDGLPDRISNDTLFWNFSNLQSGNDDFFASFNLKTSLLAGIGDTVCFEIGVTTDNIFRNSRDIELTKYYCFPIINGYDPNDIAVHPSSCHEGYVLNSDILTYKIRFQNTGNAEAININVMDTLDANIDISTFELISSSHPDILKTFLLNDSVIHFAFDEIWLKDSLNHEPESHGYVVFQVNQKANLSEGTEILNKADIYFDYNPSVVTNTVLSTVTDNIPICNPMIITSTNQISALSGSVYPNPNNGTFTISFNKVISSGRLNIFDIEGRLVDSQFINNANHGTVSKKLEVGVYYITMNSNEGIINSSFIVK